MGTCVCIWLIRFAVQQKLTQYCEAIILQERSIKKKPTYYFFLMLHVYCTSAGGLQSTLSSVWNPTLMICIICSCGSGVRGLEVQLQ